MSAETRFEGGALSSNKHKVILTAFRLIKTFRLVQISDFLLDWRSTHVPMYLCSYDLKLCFRLTFLAGSEKTIFLANDKL